MIRRPPRSTPFPTRRSSDLRVGRCFVQELAPALQRVRPMSQLFLQVGQYSQGRPARGSDRKSTRLNSSHRTISYAVFCLKKKKKTTTSTRDEYELNE